MLAPPRALFGAALALMAAVTWGGGDFAGGMAAKAAGGTVRGALRVLITAHTLSWVALVAVLLWNRGLVLHGAPVVWGLSCGVVAGASLAAFYVALARGAMGASAAISGLLAAAIPAGIGVVLEGRPTVWRSLGFAVAAAAIWMVAAPANHESTSPASDFAGSKQGKSSGTMSLAIAGGIGFGLYFAGLKMANGLGVLEPLALARTGSVLTCSLLLLAFSRGRREAGPWLTRRGWFWAAATALLDTGGNLFYIAATRAGRLDVAAVLASLYPASTILLAAAVLHERPDRRQKIGMAVALAAVVLVSL